MSANKSKSRILLEALYSLPEDQLPLFVLRMALEDTTETIKRKPTSDEQRFIAVFRALRAVERFLNSSDELKKVALPIDLLAKALYEVSEGRSPPLFARHRVTKVGRPKANLETDRLFRLQVVLAVEGLLAAGASLEEACKYVETALGQASVRQRNGKKIGTRLIKAWRSWPSSGGEEANADRNLMRAVMSRVERPSTVDEARSRARKIAQILSIS